MGCDSEWKKWLFNNFSMSFLQEPKEIANYNIIDGTELFHDTCHNYNVHSLETLSKEFVSKIQFKISSPNLEKFIILFDDLENIPINKTQTLEKRDKKNQQLTQNQLNNLIIDKSDKIIKTKDDIKSLENTRSIRNAIYCFLTEELLKNLKISNNKNGVYLIIDGGSIETLNFNGDNLKELDKLRRKSKPIIIETLINNNGFNELILKENNLIGESDLKMMYHLTNIVLYDIYKKEDLFLNNIIDNNIIDNNKEKKKKTIYINSKDSDWIYILLINLKELLDKPYYEEGYLQANINVNILLNSIPSKSTDDISKPYWINIINLWESIIIYFEKKYPEIINPIEIFCFLVTLRTTDFLEKYNLVSVKEIMNFFDNYGYKLFFSKNFKIWNLIDWYQEKETCSPIFSNLIENDYFLKNPIDEQQQLCIDEHTHSQFILLIYYKLLNKKYYENGILKKNEINKLISSAISADNLKGQSTNSRKYNLSKDGKFYLSNSRRQQWQLLYWLNGWRNKKYNCLELNLGKSEWGWILNENNECIKTNDISIIDDYLLHYNMFSP